MPSSNNSLSIGKRYLVVSSDPRMCYYVKELDRKLHPLGWMGSLSIQSTSAFKPHLLRCGAHCAFDLGRNKENSHVFVSGDIGSGMGEIRMTLIRHLYLTKKEIVNGRGVTWFFHNSNNGAPELVREKCDELKELLNRLFRRGL
ncbi:MAG: hypothetical protein AABX66_03120 [Nanoarchaeota archaeon]